MVHPVRHNDVTGRWWGAPTMLDVSDRLSGRDPLDVVVSKILIHWKESEDQRLTAALLLREAKGRVEAGEDGQFATLQAWCSEKLPGRSERDIRRLPQIANSPDPVAFGGERELMHV